MSKLAKSESVVEIHRQQGKLDGATSLLGLLSEQQRGNVVVD